MPTPEECVELLKLELPSAPHAMGVYRPFIFHDGTMLTVSGHGPLRPDGSFVRGKVGRQTGGSSLQEILTTIQRLGVSRYQYGHMPWTSHRHIRPPLCGPLRLLNPSFP